MKHEQSLGGTGYGGALTISKAHDPGGKIRLRVPGNWKCDAEFSECGRYRSKLSRVWDETNPTRLLAVMKNPSTADQFVSDPSVAKVGRLAQAWGFGGYFIGNVCDYRATDPRRLLETDEPYSARNMFAILEMAREASMILIAHGLLPAKLQFCANVVVAVLRCEGFKLHVLRMTKGGQPCHPLFLPAQLKPELWV